MADHLELLPCPFCGSAPTINDPDDGCYYVGCTECDFDLMGGPAGIGWWPSAEAAATVWNRRAPPVPHIACHVFPSELRELGKRSGEATLYSTAVGSVCTISGKRERTVPVYLWDAKVE